MVATRGQLTINPKAQRPFHSQGGRPFGFMEKKKYQMVEYLPNGSVRISYAKDSHWVRIPHILTQEAMKGLKPSERFTLLVLMSYKGKQSLICPSLRTLSAETGYSLRGIAKIIKRLEKEKYIEIFKRKGKYNTYKMLI